MNTRSFLVLILTVAVCSDTASSAQQREDLLYQFVVRLAPPLLHSAADAGLWDWDNLRLDLDRNPYLVRGDFNGDGQNDVAAYVHIKDSNERGLAIVHSTLDTVFLFTEGKPQTQMIGEYFRVLRVGTLIRPFPKTELAKPGDYDETPFRLEREAIEVNYFGKSSSLWYWANGRYINIPLFD